MGGRANANLHLNYPAGLRGTSLQAKVTYTRLLADDALNHAGVLPLRVALWADECEMPEEDIKAALVELEEKRYAYTDWKTHQVLVRTLIRNDGIADMPNVLWSACRCALNLRSEKLRRVLAGELRKLAPQPPDKVNEKTNKRYVYPDPHGTADKIDPGPPTGGEQGSREPFGTLPNPSQGSPTPGGGGGGGGKSPVGTSSSSVAPRKRGTRIPEDFVKTHITPELVAWSRERCPDVDARGETERFVLWAESTSGAKGVKLDWVKAWKNWLLEEQKRQARRPGPRLFAVPQPTPLPTDAEAAFAALRERADAKTAADLIGITWVEPSQKPSDPTPYPQWSRARRLDFIDEHREAICAALTARRTG